MKTHAEWLTDTVTVSEWGIIKHWAALVLTEPQNYCSYLYEAKYGTQTQTQVPPESKCSNLGGCGETESRLFDDLRKQVHVVKPDIWSKESVERLLRSVHEVFTFSSLFSTSRGSELNRDAIISWILTQTNTREIDRLLSSASDWTESFDANQHQWFWVRERYVYQKGSILLTVTVT